MSGRWRLGPVLLLAGAYSALPALAQVQGVLRINDERLQGTFADGSLLVYTPDPLELGSSVSHWDSSAFSNLLMEPVISSDLAFLDLDLTPDMMEDIGWSRGTSNFNIVNLDEPGVGFTDPRPFAGAPGNPATTLGEARINVFNAVLAAWANALDSPVDIDVEVTWAPLTCEAGLGAALAGASTILIFQSSDFPRPDTWYPSALAEALAGENLTGDDDDDIVVFMNSDIDEECLGPDTGFYYGLDGQNPFNQVDMAPVVLHEIGHGLGFANFSDERDGLFVQEDPSIYDHFVFDTTLGRTWAEMTAVERVTSAINPRRVTWIGPRTTEATGDFLEPGVRELVVTSPAALAGSYEVGRALFGPPIPDAGIAGQIVCMTDGDDLDSTDTTTNGCSAAANPQQLAGNIALIDRGLCDFTDKVLNAQAAGATAAIIVNGSSNAPLELGGDASLPIAIPAVSLGRDDGVLLRQEACGNEVVFLNGARFQVSAEWTTRDGLSGTGMASKLTDETGYFTFFGDDNVELVVKVLDACDVPGFNHFWVFVAGLTNVEVTLTVTDTVSGQTNTYFNPLGQAFLPIQDTSAFATCP